MADATATTRPTKPDESAYNEALAAAEKAHKAVMDKYNAIKAKIDLAQPGKAKEGAAPSPTQQRRQELISQLNEIRSKQAGGKNARTSKQDQIKRLDEQLKSRINEQKNARGKLDFKSAEDLDRQVDRLESQVNGGMMKLVDEKKALAEISNLKKQRKNFAQFDQQQKEIDDVRAKIKAIKDTMEDPESKALSEKYNKLQAELDTIKAEQDEAYKSLSSLRDERTKLHTEQQGTYQAVRKIKDDYRDQKRAFANFEREQRQKAAERRQAEHEKYVKDKKKERAQKMLAEAADPAYLDEIRRANSLLHFLDPSHQVDAASPLLANSGLGAQATRKVDDSGMKGTKLVKKEDRDDDFFAPAKKGKKGAKKGGAAAETSGKFNCPPSVLEDCAAMGIDPPMSAADIPAVTEKVKAKLEHWKSDQAAQTQRNIDKAKKEIEKIEKEEEEEANGTNGKTNGEDKEVSKVADELKGASVDDKKKEGVKA